MSEPAISETVSESPVGSDLVEPTATEITNQSFTFDDSVVKSSCRLKSPPPATPKARVLTQSFRSVVIEKSKDNSTSTLLVSVPFVQPEPSSIRKDANAASSSSCYPSQRRRGRRK